MPRAIDAISFCIGEASGGSGWGGSRGHCIALLPRYENGDTHSLSRKYDALIRIVCLPPAARILSCVWAAPVKRFCIPHQAWASGWSSALTINIFELGRVDCPSELEGVGAVYLNLRMFLLGLNYFEYSVHLLLLIQQLYCTD